MKLLLLILGSLCAVGCMRNVDLPAARTLSGEAVREGCLNRTPSGEYVLADSKTGESMNVMGNPALEYHAGNHAVRVIGLLGTESGGRGMRVIQIEHLAGACRAPFPK